MRMPTSPSDQLPLDELISLSVAETRKRTGWPLSTVYDLINRHILETYTLGRRRFVVAASLRRLIAERAATPLGGALPPRGRRGRFVTSCQQGDEVARDEARRRDLRRQTANRRLAMMQARRQQHEFPNQGIKQIAQTLFEQLEEAHRRREGGATAPEPPSPTPHVKRPRA